MTPSTLPAHVVVRLSEADRNALATVLTAIHAPHRAPATISEAVRAALAHAAASVTATGTLGAPCARA